MPYNGNSDVATDTDSNQSPGAEFERLVRLMAQLRSPGGCPWDREQTFDTIKRHTVEETYEVLDAIDRRDMRGLCEELGDYTLQAVFYAQMAAEQGDFSITDSLRAINEKLIRRHPHIFGDAEARTADDVKQRWDQIKAEEKATRGETPNGQLDGVPRAMPALLEATELTRRAAQVRFDWDGPEPVLAKLHEELDELAQARRQADHAAIEDEMGDLLFAAVNLARHLHVDPEQALRRTNRKFRDRFGHVERRLAEQGRSPAEATLDEMETLWQEAKHQR